ncbi:MAG: hypothetical protein JSU87_17915 [Gemmatimonadota bacterium]|nr:MAG: hypothetical protein JSU87_17915 [Gemmatimonadota bacterium]
MATADPSNRPSDLANAGRVNQSARAAAKQPFVARMHQSAQPVESLRQTGAYRVWALLCAAVLAIAACGDDGPTELPGPTNTIGPEGGTVRFAGGALVLEVPAGALLSPVTIDIRTAGAFPEDVALIEGTVYELQPEGTRFARPATLTIRYDPARLAPDVPDTSLELHSVVADEWRPVEGSSSSSAQRIVTAPIAGLGVYGVKTPTPGIAALDAGNETNVAIAWSQPQWIRITGADIVEGAAVNLDDLDNDGRPPYCIWEPDKILVAADTIWFYAALGNLGGRWTAQILNPPLDDINTFYRTCEGRNASPTLSFSVFTEASHSPLPYQLEAPWDAGQYRVAETYEHHAGGAPLTRAVDLHWAASAGSREIHPDSTAFQPVRAAHDGIADIIVWEIPDCALDGSAQPVSQTNLVIDFGTLRTEYAQLRIDPQVVGQPVHTGDVIGWVADPETEPEHAGCSSTPHLHLNVYHKWDGRFDFAEASLALDNSNLVTLAGQPVFPVPWDGALGEGIGSWGSNWTGWDPARGHTFAFGALPRGSAADLIVRNASIEPSSIGAGGTFTLEFEIYNQGQTAAGTSTTRIQLSEDADINEADRTLELLPTPALAAQGLASFGRSLLIPADVNPGEYHIGITADATGSAGQEDRTNDLAVVPLSVISLTSNLVVTTSTAGDDLDPDGYLVCLNGSDCRPININGQITFADVGDGAHDVELTDVAENCTVAPPNPRTVAIETGTTGQTGFEVSCQERLSLVFLHQPDEVPDAKAVFPAGYPICPPLQVEVRDRQGDPVPSFANLIGLRIGVNPSAGSLSGGEPVAPLEGRATFESVSIDAPGEGYTLVADGEGAFSVESVPFKIGLPGDLDLNDRVDQFDEDTLVAHWSESGACLPGDFESLVPADINKDGTVDDLDLNILRSSWTAPSATTDAANLITSSSARLNATVNPNGRATNAWFEWGTDPSLGVFESTALQSVGSGTVAERVRQRIFGLSPATTYYYRVVASSAGGLARGSIISFTTDPG